MARLEAAVVLATALLVSGVAEATQHLMRPGDNWEAVDSRLKPGDEIILMTGRHRAATLRNAIGTGDEPITIRGLDPTNPPLIEAERYGIRLCGARHVRISDVRISGATINGILIEGAFPADADSADADSADVDSADANSADRGGDSGGGDAATGLTDGSVSLVNVFVGANGPQATPGQRHAIHLRHLDGVELTGCRVEGWAGSAVEIVGCRNVRVLKSTFIGRPEFIQSSGVRIRAGSERVRVEASRFRNAGDQAVCIGAGSKLHEFIESNDATSGPRFEASRVQVRRNVFEEGLSAVAFVDAQRATVRHCTIIRPRRAVVSVRHEQKDARFGGIQHCSFGTNLVVWQPGDLRMITHVGPEADASVLTLEENLWWAPDLAETLEELGGFIGEQAFPQITDVDPRLDDALRPQEERAAGFGADL